MTPSRPPRKETPNVNTDRQPPPPQPSVPTGTWKVDPVHSSVEFQVKHLGIATVKGQFKEFEGTLEVGPDGAVAYGTVKTASVDTREPQRDEHLRSADFFEAENYPEISFRSTAIRADRRGRVRDRGRPHDPRRHAPGDAEGHARGHRAEPPGQRARRHLRHTQINRSDFEMRFNAALGSGNMVVSDKVKILLDVSAVKAD